MRKRRDDLRSFKAANGHHPVKLNFTLARSEPACGRLADLLSALTRWPLETCLHRLARGEAPERTIALI